MAMTFRSLVAALVLVAAPLAAAPPHHAVAAHHAAPARVDWTKAIAATPRGYLIGNPAAKVKLIEYGSYTCPHCRAFAAEAMGPLKAKYIATGRLSFEFRSFVRNGPDYAATLLAGCDGAARQAALTETLFATQLDWMKPFEALDDATIARINATPQERQIAALAKAGGIDRFFVQRGLTAARADACLADKAAADRLTASLKAAVETDHVDGTPGFLIDGVRQTSDFLGQVRGVTTWAELEPRLAQSLR